MFEAKRSRMKERLAEARARETKFLMSFDLASLNRKMFVLLIAYVALNFFDTFTTLLAINAGPIFVERNPIAAGLFRLDFAGFVLALVLKYMPLLPLAYATFAGPREDGRMTLRIVKVGALVALAAADMFYVIVVGSNSLNLASFYG